MACPITQGDHNEPQCTTYHQQCTTMSTNIHKKTSINNSTLCTQLDTTYNGSTTSVPQDSFGGSVPRDVQPGDLCHG